MLLNLWLKKPGWEKESISIASSACHLFHVSFLPSQLSENEDGCNMFLRSYTFHWTMQHYISENRTLH
jgi:hypothetical protein